MFGVYCKMTEQKSPEEIADDIVREWYGTSGCQKIYEGIVEAIKEERSVIKSGQEIKVPDDLKIRKISDDESLNLFHETHYGRDRIMFIVGAKWMRAQIILMNGPE